MDANDAARHLVAEKRNRKNKNPLAACRIPSLSQPGGAANGLGPYMDMGGVMVVTTSLEVSFSRCATWRPPDLLLIE